MSDPLPVSTAVDTFMQSANQAAMKTAVGVPTIAATGDLLKGDGAGGAIASGVNPSEVLVSSSNLSDVSDTTLSRTNLGLGNVVNVDSSNADNLVSGTIPDGRYPSSALGAIISAAAISPFSGTVANPTSITVVNGIVTDVS